MIAIFYRDNDYNDDNPMDFGIPYFHPSGYQLGPYIFQLGLSSHDASCTVRSSMPAMTGESKVLDV